MSVKSELMIFNEEHPQVVIESANIVDVLPQTSLAENANTIEFNIIGSDVEYLDLNDTLLYLRLKITTSDGKNLTDAAATCPANFLMNALFKDVTLSLNDTIIEGGTQMYPYKSTIASIFGFNKSTRQIQLESMGYLDNPEDRKKLIGKSRIVELCGALRLDFLNQPKYLIPGVNVRITLTRSDDRFAFTAGAGAAAIKLLHAKLYVRRVRVSPSVLRGHEVGLTKKNAVYPYNRSQVVSYTIPQGSHSHFRDNVFSSSLLPKFVVVGFVSASGFNGSEMDSDPFGFTHFDIQSIGLFRDGQSLPYREIYEPNFSNDLYLREYMKSIIHNTQHLNTNFNNGITLKDFSSGNYCFFTFNLTPDFDMLQTQMPRDGNLRLEIRFRTQLKEPINVIVYGTFDTHIQINKQREIVCSHVH